MAPRRGNREQDPITPAIEGLHWETYVDDNGAERFRCLCRPCPTQGHYCRKDALNRHMVPLHHKKTERIYRIRVNRRPMAMASGREMARAQNRTASLSVRQPGTVRTASDILPARGGAHLPRSPFKRSSCIEKCTSSRPPYQSMAGSSKFPAILNRPRSRSGMVGNRTPDIHRSGALVPEEVHMEVGHGSPAYRGLQRKNKMKLPRQKKVHPTSPATPDEENQKAGREEDAATRPPPSPLSPIEITRYSPHQLKVSGCQNVFQTICCPDDPMSPFDQFYRDCEPPKCGASTRGNCASRPIRITESPNKALASGIPGEGTLNARWEGGGKSTFFLPLQKKKMKMVDDVDDALPDLDADGEGQTSGGVDALHFDTPDLSLPSVSQLMSDLQVTVESTEQDGLPKPMNVDNYLDPIPADGGNSSMAMDNDFPVVPSKAPICPLSTVSESQRPPSDGHGNFCVSQMLQASQLPSLSQLSLPGLEDDSGVADYAEIESVNLVDYASDSAVELDEIY